MPVLFRQADMRNGGAGRGTMLVVAAVLNVGFVRL